MLFVQAAYFSPNYFWIADKPEVEWQEARLNQGWPRVRSPKLPVNKCIARLGL